jgi:hypothetical protein
VTHFLLLEPFLNIFFFFQTTDVAKNDLLTTSKTMKSLSMSKDIFETPIVIIINHCKSRHFPLLLETILRQPEIDPSKVIIYDNLTCTWSVFSLVKLFHFNYQIYKNNESNTLESLFQNTYQLYPKANQIILIEDSVVLSSDFFPFMGQLLPLLHSSTSNVFAISAWNENSLQNVSQDSTRLYRADVRKYKPRFGAMFKKGVTFCTLQKSTLWSFDDVITIPSNDMDIIFPDISRVYFTLPYPNLISKTEQDYFLQSSMHLRTVSL